MGYVLVPEGLLRTTLVEIGEFVHHFDGRRLPPMVAVKYAAARRKIEELRAVVPPPPPIVLSGLGRCSHYDLNAGSRIPFCADPQPHERCLDCPRNGHRRHSADFDVVSGPSPLDPKGDGSFEGPDGAR